VQTVDCSVFLDQRLRNFCPRTECLFGERQRFEEWWNLICFSLEICNSDTTAVIIKFFDRGYRASRHSSIFNQSVPSKLCRYPATKLGIPTSRIEQISCDYCGHLSAPKYRKQKRDFFRKQSLYTLSVPRRRKNDRVNSCRESADSSQQDKSHDSLPRTSRFLPNFSPTILVFPDLSGFFQKKQQHYKPILIFGKLLWQHHRPKSSGAYKFFSR